MEIVIVALVPVVAFLVWAVAYDLKRRRRNEPPANVDERETFRNTRMGAQGKASEWDLPDR